MLAVVICSCNLKFLVVVSINPQGVSVVKGICSLWR